MNVFIAFIIMTTCVLNDQATAIYIRTVELITLSIS